MKNVAPNATKALASARDSVAEDRIRGPRGFLKRLWIPAFAGMTILLFPVCSNAVCECEPLTHEERMEQASLVFSGALLEITTDKSTGKRTMLFDVASIYKGDAVDELRLTDVDQGQQCELVLQEGKPFLVFAHWQWGKWVTSQCWGTKPLEQAKEEADVLGLPTSAKEKLYGEMQKRCMGLYTTSCCLASIRAMRKGYYLPEPTTGCPAGYKPDTLRCAGALPWCIPITDTRRATSANPSK